MTEIYQALYAARIYLFVELFLSAGIPLKEVIPTNHLSSELALHSV